MGVGQTKNREFIWFSSESATCWDHVTQLIYISGHLATSTPFNLTMALPTRGKHGAESVSNWVCILGVLARSLVSCWQTLVGNRLWEKGVGCEGGFTDDTK